MVRSLWKRTKLYCANHEHPVEMTIQMKGETPFYACPWYYQQCDVHPDGRPEGEKACVNHISMNDCEKMIDHLSEIIEGNIANDIYGSLRGEKWKNRRGIEYEVLDDENQLYKIKVLNKTALK